MGLFHIFGELADLISSLRFYLGVILSVPLAIWLHDHFGSTVWVWFFSIPIVIVGIGGGWAWQWSHDKKTNSR